MLEKKCSIIITLVTTLIFITTSLSVIGLPMKEIGASQSSGYGGQIRVYITEPRSVWRNYDGDPYHYGFVDFAMDETLSIGYQETYENTIVYDGHVSQNNVFVIAAVFNPVSEEKYAYPPFQNPFNAHFVDAAAGSEPGETGHNTVNENFTHTVFIEEGTGTWCPYCPSMAEALNNIYETGEYPFYFVAMIEDKVPTARERLINDYNVAAYPTAFFDGGNSIVVGGGSSESSFIRKIERCGSRDVHDLNLSVSVSWLGDGDLEITVRVTNLENSPPQIPSITGPTEGKVNTEQFYDIVSTDPDGDDVYYCVTWGDETEEVCMGPYGSDEIATISHIWAEEGSYSMQVKARDLFDQESDWATLEVTMPKQKSLFDTFWYQFLCQLFDFLI